MKERTRCPICGREVYVRKDGMFPLHRNLLVPRKRIGGRLVHRTCKGSNTKAEKTVKRR